MEAKDTAGIGIAFLIKKNFTNEYAVAVEVAENREIKQVASFFINDNSVTSEQQVLIVAFKQFIKELPREIPILFIFGYNDFFYRFKKLKRELTACLQAEGLKINLFVSHGKLPRNKNFRREGRLDHLAEDALERKKTIITTI